MVIWVLEWGIVVRRFKRRRKPCGVAIEVRSLSENSCIFLRGLRHLILGRRISVSLWLWESELFFHYWRFSVIVKGLFDFLHGDSFCNRGIKIETRIENFHSLNVSERKRTNGCERSATLARNQTHLSQDSSTFVIISLAAFHKTPAVHINDIGRSPGSNNIKPADVLAKSTHHLANHRSLRIGELRQAAQFLSIGVSNHDPVYCG